MSTPIKREDIKAGDRYRIISERTASVNLIKDTDWGTTYELIERPVVLPTVPGLYLDKDGDVWKLTAPNNRWFCLADTKYDYREAEFAPFTLLRPVAEVAAEVLAEVKSSIFTGAFMQIIDGKPEVTMPLARNLGVIAAKFGVAK